MNANKSIIRKGTSMHSMLRKKGTIICLFSSLLFVACESPTTNTDESGSSTIATGSITDSRDGKIYKTITIGGRNWMAENLAYSGNGNVGECYGENASNCNKYGRLYTWPEALALGSSQTASSGGICPQGWHIPDTSDFNHLVRDAGGFNALKSSIEWNGNGSNFAALPAGEYALGYCGIGQWTAFWGSDQSSTLEAWTLYLGTSNYAVQGLNISHRLSIRCVEGAAKSITFISSVPSQPTQPTQPAASIKLVGTEWEYDYSYNSSLTSVSLTMQFHFNTSNQGVYTKKSVSIISGGTGYTGYTTNATPVYEYHSFSYSISGYTATLKMDDGNVAIVTYDGSNLVTSKGQIFKRTF